MQSLLGRAPYLNSRGDLLLVLLLLWGCVLPLASTWSVDAALAQPSTKPVRRLCLATAVYPMQVMAVYVLSGMCKKGEDW